MSDWYYNNNGHFYKSGMKCQCNCGSSELKEDTPFTMSLTPNPRYIEIGKTSNVTLAAKITAGTAKTVTVDNTEGTSKVVTLEPTLELSYTYTASATSNKNQKALATAKVDAVYPIYWGSTVVDTLRSGPEAGAPIEIDWESEDGISRILNATKRVSNYSDQITSNFLAKAPDFDHCWIVFVAYPAEGNASKLKATFIDSLLNQELFYTSDETTTINDVEYRIARTLYTAGTDGMIFTKIKLL